MELKILFLNLMSIAMFNSLGILGKKLTCEFRINNWAVGDLYECKVKDSGIFNGSRVTIDSIEGQHLSGKTIDDVQGINIHSILNVSFFPVNIEKHFKNLIAINIRNSQVQEISSNDLQPFPNLKTLGLGANNIKVIERDTFKYNLQLRGIWLWNNEISHIDYKVFDGLDHLEKLDLSNNKCKKSISEANTRSETLSRIQQIRDGDCYEFDPIIQKAINTTSEKLSSKIDVLKTQSDKVDSKVNELTQNFNGKLEANNEINKIKFSENEAKFSALFNKMEQKYEDLNAKSDKLNMEIQNQIKNLDNQLQNKISQKFNELQSEDDKMNSKIKEIDMNHTLLKRKIDKTASTIDDLTYNVEKLRNDLNDKLQDNFNKSLITNEEIHTEVRVQVNNLTDDISQKFIDLKSENEETNSEFFTLIKTLNESFYDNSQNYKSTSEKINQITLGMIIACSVSIILFIILSIILMRLCLKSKTTNGNKMKKIKKSQESDTVNNPIYEEPLYYGTLTTCSQLSE